MSHIKILQKELAGLIAAGEVVERPASVVKELVENSLDAQAKRIVVEVENGGKDLIRVTDDGVGMDRDDAAMAFARHATSKISSVLDLSCIQTFGFRGEALASIAAVAYVTLKTRPAGNIEGTQLCIKTGRIDSVSAVGFSMGTQIEVNHLFINVPARKKFLKTDATEFGHISKTMTHFALAHHDVAFKFINNGKEIFDLPRSKDLFERVKMVLGQELGSDLVSLYYGGESLHMDGFIGIPEIARRNRFNQYLFLNGREISDPAISRAVLEGYHSLLAKEKYPVFVLKLKIEPSMVDVNVHPRKLEVKFLNAQQVFQAVSMSVKEALEKTSLSPMMAQTSKTSFTIRPVGQDRPASGLGHAQGSSFSEPFAYEYSTGSIAKPSGFAALSAFEKSAQSYSSTPAQPTKPPSQMSAAEKRQFFLERRARQMGVHTPSQVQAALTFTKETLAMPEAALSPRQTIDQLNLKPIAQVNNSYILASDHEGMVIIDQHAAHERVLYMKLMHDAGQGQVVRQQLLTPFQMELSYREAAVLGPQMELLKQVGFELEWFGNRTLLVQTIPAFLHKDNLAEVMRGVLDDLLEEKSVSEVGRREEKILMYVACHSAVKFGRAMAHEEIMALLSQLEACTQKFTCPHGRPTMIKMTYDELGRRFGRG